MKFRIKKGDTVVMRRGTDRGKSGKVLHVDLRAGRVVVEGLNVVKKHVRPKRQGEKGEQVSVPRPVPLGAVALYCGHCNRPTRIGMKVDGEQRTRVCRRCENTL
jgi:large subunit ribosomal protein L24